MVTGSSETNAYFSLLNPVCKIHDAGQRFSASRGLAFDIQLQILAIGLAYRRCQLGACDLVSYEHISLQRYAMSFNALYIDVARAATSIYHERNNKEKHS